MRPLRDWFAIAIPIVGIVELAAHLHQTRRGPSASDYDAAHRFAQSQMRKADLLVFAPAWLEPIGRKEFSDLVTPELAGVVDEQRYQRAVEVSVRGTPHPALDGWTQKESSTFGDLRVRILENPKFEPRLDTLSKHVNPSGLEVQAAGSPCPFTRTGASGATWGFGTPKERFACGGGFVGLISTFSLDYRPRTCILAPPPGSGRTLRLRFRDIHFGTRIVGHHGIHGQWEHRLEQPTVTATFRVLAIEASDPMHLRERDLGSITHRNGGGWLGFEINTREISGEVGDLLIDVTSVGGPDYPYCFDADSK